MHDLDDLFPRRKNLVRKMWWRLTAFPSRMYWNIRNGLIAVRYWLPVIWRWRSWDWEYSLEVFIHSLRALDKAISKGPHLSREKDSRRLRETIELLDRIRKDEFISTTIDNTPMIEIHRKRDTYYWNRLNILLSKHMKGWWT